MPALHHGNVPHCSLSFRLFIPHSLLEYHSSFFPEVFALDVLPWLDFSCGNYSPTAAADSSLRLLVPSSSLIRCEPIQGSFGSSMKLLGIISVGFDITDQLLIRFFCICQILQEKWEYNETVHQLFIDFKKAYDTVRRDVLCDILIEFGVPMKLVRLIEMCLNETYSKVRIGTYMVLRRVFGLKRDEVMGGWRKLHEGIYTLNQV
jgi:hypothetical protein